ncbi:hypothetical protein NUW58_g7512 [Xylaria curta]|uniref:Uncharacterized protein n=1 Tax=Xylaria curta TaxID=42375 RepID=A0ACC1NHW9_9PEZI|nr:hypothetical protein NUW58_g7512 [Xylaria curta]
MPEALGRPRTRALHPREQEYNGLRDLVLGELPFDTVKSVLQHQWHKDVRRIIYAHAEHYHDQSLFDFPPSHKKQLLFIEADLKRHRAKYVMHYLHAVVEVYRHEEVGATRVTMNDEISIRAKLEAALSYKLPSDLDAVFRQAKPYAWKGTMTWEQSKRYYSDAQHDMANHVFGHGYVQQVIDRGFITVISIMSRLYGSETDDGLIVFIPKTPDPMWCWNQTTNNIEEFQHMTKLDLM